MLKKSLYLLLTGLALFTLGCCPEMADEEPVAKAVAPTTENLDFVVGTGWSENTDPIAAAKKATQGAIAKLNGATLKGVIFYENYKGHEKEAEIGQAVQSVLPEGVSSIGVRAIPHTMEGSLWEHSIGVMAIGGEDANVAVTSAKLVDTRLSLGRMMANEVSKVENLRLVMALSEMNLSFAPNNVSVEDFLKGMYETLGDDVKVFGGNGEPNEFPLNKTSYQFINGKALNGYIVMMGIGGPIRMIGSNANEFKASEKVVTVTKASGKWVHEFDGRPAAEVYRELSGKKPDEQISYDWADPIGVDLGDGQMYVRMVLFEVKPEDKYNKTDKEFKDYMEESKGMPVGSLRFVADVPEGTPVRVLMYQESFKDILESATEAVDRAFDLMKPSEKPLAVMTSSCCARRMRLRSLDKNADEVLQGILPAAKEHDITVFGLDAWGELGPLNRPYKGVPYQYQQHTFVMGVLVLSP